MGKFMNKKKINKIAGAMLAAAMTVSLSGCGLDKEKTGKENDVLKDTKYEAENLIDDLQVAVNPPKKIDDDVKASAIDFSINLFKTSAMEDINKGNNVLISPESVLLALGMTTNGASGETLSQMEQVLCPGYGIDELNEFGYAIMDKQRNNSSVDFNIANSIWIKDDGDNLNVSEDFLLTDKTYYDAAVFKADFSENTLNDINSWVEDNTNGMIKKILDSISPNAVMYLINAMAFDGKWEEEYDDAAVRENTDFTNFDQSVSKVNMLYSQESYYMSDESCQAFIKPYKGGEYGFMAILPNEGIELNDYISNMTKEGFLDLYNNKNYDVTVSAGIPEFSADYNILMNEVLKTMGMNNAFDIDNAEFDNMVKSKEENIYIERVIHKTHIDVDRNGTKASAATVVEVSKESSMEDVRDVKTVILDRPFVYAIVDIDAGMPIFIGAVNSIK